MYMHSASYFLNSTTKYNKITFELVNIFPLTDVDVDDDSSDNNSDDEISLSESSEDDSMDSSNGTHKLS